MFVECVRVGVRAYYPRNMNIHKYLFSLYQLPNIYECYTTVGYNRRLGPRARPIIVEWMRDLKLAFLTNQTIEIKRDSASGPGRRPQIPGHKVSFLRTIRGLLFPTLNKSARNRIRVRIKIISITFGSFWLWLIQIVTFFDKKFNHTRFNYTYFDYYTTLVLPVRLMDIKRLLMTEWMNWTWICTLYSIHHSMFTFWRQ